MGQWERQHLAMTATCPEGEAWAASRNWNHGTHFLWDPRAAPTFHPLTTQRHHAQCSTFHFQLSNRCAVTVQDSWLHRSHTVVCGWYDGWLHSPSSPSCVCWELQHFENEIDFADSEGPWIEIVALSTAFGLYRALRQPRFFREIYRADCLLCT